MSFQIEKKDSGSQARVGVLKTAHGEVKTPVFLPIGTKATVKSLSNDDIRDLGARMILANTYHLWMAPGDDIIARAGGVHGFMNWDGALFTDSGGFQIFSLGEKAERRADADRRELPFNVKIEEEGVTFQRGIDGQTFQLTPERSVQIQANLGSDVAVVLDEFTGDIENRAKVFATVERTSRWAKRSKDEFERLRASGKLINTGQIQLGIVQGGLFDDLREQSAKELRQIGFEGYAIGGVAVGGESSEMQYQAVDMSVPHLEEEKYKHLLGVGTPEQIIEGVARGMDSFDCVIPTREARHGRLYVNKKNGYSLLDIAKKDLKDDFSKIDESCVCYTCTHHTKAYVNHLFRENELLGLRLASIHNLAFYLSLMKRIRAAIQKDAFQQLRSEYKKIGM